MVGPANCRRGCRHELRDRCFRTSWRERDLYSRGLDSRGLEPWLRPWAEWLILHYPSAIVTSTYRSYTEQLELWLTRFNNPFPVAPPGQSYHEYGRAFDLSAPPEVLEQLGRIWIQVGGGWSESDPIHFQA